MRSREEVFARVKKVTIDILGCDEDAVKEGAYFIHDLSADSLELLEICLECEKEFDMTIHNYDFEKLNTVGELVDYILEGKLPTR